jgi:hypothetical protein
MFSPHIDRLEASFPTWSILLCGTIILDFYAEEDILEST